MMDKEKKKFKDLDIETKTTYFYGIILVFIIIVAFIVKFTTHNSKEKKACNESVVQEEIIDYKKVLNSISDNYELDIVINKYYFNEYVNIKKQGINEIINVNKFDSNSIYSQDDMINENIDMVFINPLNILKLLNVQTYSSKNKYIIETNNWLNLYNEINNTKIEKNVTGEISIEFLSKENNEYIIEMDLTNLYKNLNYDYQKVIYNMKFYNINKTILSNNN